MTEDVLTGRGIHARGWRSVFCTPKPPPFLGWAPMGGPACMTQQKRWATGLLEILFSKNSPILATLTAKLQFRQCLGYLYIVVWGLRSIPELCYAGLPPYCILTNTYFIPKISEPAIFIIGALFIIFNLYTLSEYLRSGLSIRTWWNNQRMARITSATAWLFGFLSVVVKLLGLSETVFEVTRKDQNTTDDGNDTDAGRFTFDESPVFVPATALVLVHLTALTMGLVGVQPSARGGYGSGLGEVICCAWVVLNFLPFVKGLVGKGKYGIPSSTLCKSSALAVLFVHLCRWASRGSLSFLRWTCSLQLLEPPIITVNTVLSLLAVDYPAHKLACYVSDDAGSPLTFYSLVEAAKFAKLWVPFCKKYDIPVRAPFQYFSIDLNSSSDVSSNFLRDWREMKDEYEQLSRRIEEAIQKSVPRDFTVELATFSKIERRNHPSIVKVIWENKDNLPNGVPRLLYVSREKRPKHPHHFKAGAMNVLTRVSGVMTNAPFMLNVDCDMFANNPQIVLHAMCLLLTSDKEREYAFVQCPQLMYGGLKDDPFGNQLIVMQEVCNLHVIIVLISTIFVTGVGGIQGPFYGGMGCFHRRKDIYGLLPIEAKIRGRNLSSVNGKSHDEVLHAKFGKSIVFTKSVDQILSGITAKTDNLHDLSSSLEAANQVAGCNYEHGTYWGTTVSDLDCLWFDF
ncbi:hypothetical protein HHK36_018037 [Tetracentron sinense]|uniref:Cellulose synthase-like protein H1 n=1 Tax=Tetracentron sinense TaxID=13715 RepID=A0A835DAG6_TETSI|nr:hypothetical protein HHK36_018037 [Tetracentron sinense]